MVVEEVESGREYVRIRRDDPGLAQVEKWRRATYYEGLESSRRLGTVEGLQLVAVIQACRTLKVKEPTKEPT